MKTTERLLSAAKDLSCACSYEVIQDMPEELKKALPDINDLKKLLDTDKAWEENK